jgi:hypothetical protein
VSAAFDTVGQWNEVLMGTVRQLRGQAVPEYARVTCQSDDPSGYCFCQCDPDDVAAGVACDSTLALNPTCAGRYDAFESPEEARTHLVSGEPFDCHVVVPEGAEPNMPTARSPSASATPRSTVGSGPAWRAPSV